MFSRVLLVLFAVSSFVICSSRTLAPSSDDDSLIQAHLHTYIVDVDSSVYRDDCMEYQQLLRRVVRGRSSKDALIFCYKYVKSGFAAALTEAEAQRLKGEEGIFGVTKDTIIHMINDGSY